MDFLLLGSNYFKNALEKLGHQAFWAGSDPLCDLCLPANKLDIPYILSRLSCSPQAIILTDDLGRRVFPSGLEKTSLLKVWYAVDGPLNFFWQKEYAALFDLVLTDQKNCAEKLSQFSSIKTSWLPVGIDTALYQGPAVSRVFDLAFVGSVDKKARPKRYQILKLLSDRYSVRVAGGRQEKWVSPRDAAKLYRQARMVLNENLFDGVTTRMLEGMAAGTMLLTEKAENGLEDLFRPYQEFVPFGPYELFEQVEYYLQNKKENERIAAQGRERVIAGHDIRHRAEKLLSLMALASPETGLKEGGIFFRQQGKALFLAAMRWPDHGSSWINRAETLLKRSDYLNQADKDALFYLGVLQMLRRKNEKAIACFENAESLGSLRAGLALGYLALMKNNRTAASGRFIKTLRKYDKQDITNHDLFKKFSDNHILNADQHFTLGRILESRGHDLTPGFSRFGLNMSLWNALEHYRQAVVLDPKHLEALTQLGRLLVKYRAYTEAYPFLARAAEINAQSTELASEAHMAGQLGYLLV
ncbi:MAG: glycosyltransferase [Deltaproteobacteria bacterium]|nr:glycosyltransferase [Deltaproteobacteria bacterium]